MKDKILGIMEDNTSYERVFGSMENEYVLDRDKAADEICQMMADEIARQVYNTDFVQHFDEVKAFNSSKCVLNTMLFTEDQIDNALNKIK